MAGVLKSAGSNVVRLVVVMACQFMLVPITLHALGTDKYGVYALALSVLGFFGLLELGAGTAAVKYAAAARGSGDIPGRNSAISTLLIMSLASSAFAALCVAVLAFAFPVLFPVPAALRSEAVIAFVLLGGRSALLAWPAGVFRSTLIGDNRISAANSVQIVTSIGLTFTTWLFLKMGWSLIGVAASSLIWFAVEGGAYVVLCRKHVQEFRVSRSQFDRKLLRQVSSLSMSQLFITVSGMILLRTDPIIVGKFLTIGAVAQYGVALRVSENVFQLAKQYVNALSPSIARLYGAKDEAGLRRLFVSSSRHATIAAGALVVGVVPWSDRLLLGWVGPKMLPAAPVMAILSLAMALCTVQMVVSNFLTFTDRHKKTVPFTTVGMLLNVAMSLLLVTRMGLAGVACGTLVSVLIVDVVYASWLGATEFGVNWREYVVQGPLRPAFCALAVTLAVWQGKAYLPDMSLPTAALASLVSVGVYAALYFGAASSADDKAKAQWIWNNLLKKLQSLRGLGPSSIQ